MLIACIASFFALESAQQVSLYANCAFHSGIALCVGLVFSLVAFALGGREAYARCVTVDQVDDVGTVRPGVALADETPSALARFYLGHRWNAAPAGVVDVKMFLYLVGACGLALNIASCAVAQRHHLGHTSLAMGVYVACFAWFLIEYLVFEEVHLYTYDLFAEKLGFKLIWGCLFFYPFCYAIGALPLVTLSTGVDLSPAASAGCVTLFFVGWILTRGANMQKFYFRTAPQRARFLCVQQRSLGGRLLTSGFWGVSRHVNYFGEILQAVALSLPSLLTLQRVHDAYAALYVVYYVALFVPRQIADDKMCAKKYGALWDEYERIVKYRIVPYVW